jgi:hypothetical protein
MGQTEDTLICITMVGCIIAVAAVIWDMIDAYKTRH